VNAENLGRYGIAFYWVNDFIELRTCSLVFWFLSFGGCAKWCFKWHCCGCCLWSMIIWVAYGRCMDGVRTTYIPLVPSSELDCSISRWIKVGIRNLRWTQQKICIDGGGAWAWAYMIDILYLLELLVWYGMVYRVLHDTD
jgi:hypothetical protein